MCPFLFAPICFKTNLIKSRFLIFLGQFQTAMNSTPSPSEAEKLGGSGGKKSNRLPQEVRFLDPKQQKKRYFITYIDRLS